MDFKGITWVGNVYQKFETMCLDVEEIIVQDTAKYVENQVQNVGNTFKKFYSDVVQDFLPDDDSVGSGKPLPGSMLHDYAAPVCSFEKNVNRKIRDVKREQDVTEGKKDGCEMKLRGLDADDYYICTSPRQYSYGGPYRRTRLGRKQMFKKEEFSSQCSKPYVQKIASNLLMDHNARVKDDVGAVKSNDSPPGEQLERLISKEECQKDDRTENQHGLTVVNSVRDQDSGVRTENEHGLTVVRSQDSETQSVATSLPAGSDGCREETDEDSTQTSSSSVSEQKSSSVSNQKSEILQQRSGESVEESCIIVDRDEVNCVFPDMKENEKHKPYKKIRDAISSRMQNREKEYKRLARQWYAEDVENGIECDENPKPVEENRSTEESEWELL